MPNFIVMSSFRWETLNSCRIELGTRAPNMSVVEDSLAPSPLLLFIHLGPLAHRIALPASRLGIF